MTDTPHRKPRFATTLWSDVLAAGGASDGASREALERLCESYWHPLYTWVRREGHDPEAAADLVQGFFADFLARRDFEKVSPERGRFRSWLLTCLRHYVANTHDRARAVKRGGGRTLLSLDVESAESRYALEPASDRTAESGYERRWALRVLERALEELEGEYARDGRAALFTALHPHLLGSDADPYADTARTLGTTRGAVRVAAHRLRRRYREVLRLVVSETVERPEDVEDELRSLFAALRS